jgi:hypothetical protein
MDELKEWRQPGLDDDDAARRSNDPAHFSDCLIHVRRGEEVMQSALDHGNVDGSGLQRKFPGIANDPTAGTILRHDESR